MDNLPMGQAIRNIRIHRKLLPCELARKMLCPRSYVFKVENGFLLSIGIDNLARFAVALDIEPWKLVRYACKLRKQQEAA